MDAQRGFKYELQGEHLLLYYCSFMTKYRCHGRNFLFDFDILFKGIIPSLLLLVSEGLAAAMEQICWHVLSTNEIWQMHKSFRLCRVEILVWHRLGMFEETGSLRKAHAIPDLLKWSIFIMTRPIIMWDASVSICATDLTTPTIEQTDHSHIVLKNIIRLVNRKLRNQNP